MANNTSSNYIQEKDDNFLIATHASYFGYQGKGENAVDGGFAVISQNTQEGNFISDSEQIVFEAPNKANRVSILEITCSDLCKMIYSTAGGTVIPMFVKVYIGKGEVGLGPRFLIGTVTVHSLEGGSLNFLHGHPMEPGERLYARFEDIGDVSATIGDSFDASYGSGSSIGASSNKRINLCTKYYVHGGALRSHLKRGEDSATPRNLGKYKKGLHATPGSPANVPGFVHTS